MKRLISGVSGSNFDFWARDQVLSENGQPEDWFGICRTARRHQAMVSLTEFAGTWDRA